MPHPVVLFSVDGMRPDALQLAETPCIDKLIASGASTMCARTVMPSVTLPCHTSMHRGVDVPRHGITSNTFQPLARPVPGLFDVAKAQGLTTAMFCNWGELRDLMEPASLDFFYAIAEAQTNRDHLVAEAAAEHVERNDLNLTFVYLGFTDTAGHASGWMSETYLAAIEQADKCIAQVLGAYAKRGLTPNVLVLSDHGGHERSHGTDMPEDMTIPWILNGPSIKAGYEITNEVRIFDACTTLASLAGLKPAKQWEGRVVSEAFSEQWWCYGPA
jgi:predicted AlkP superfamily pyrophosphatase or phosphodiesterase